jgi:phenylacetate-CoA ligase
MNLRKTFFYFLDKIKGNPVLEHLRQIQMINDSEDIHLMDNYQANQLNIILTESTRNTLFYKKYNPDDITNFPVINKSIIKANENLFISEKYDKKKLIRNVTSGSTGTPFPSYRDINKKNRNTADVLYFGKQAGFEIGEPLFYLKIWSSANRKSRIKRFIENIYPIDVINLSGSNVRKFIGKLLNVKANIHINGYSSALEEVCKYLDGNTFEKLKNKSIKSIITQSEAVSDETKKRLEKYLNCKVCSRYSNLENGILAQQTINNNDNFKINNASYYIEILKVDSDEPVKPNEYGRIVITDLYNFAMPFIRYDTGDIGRFGINEDGSINKFYFSDIQGRKLDLLLDTKGNVVSSYIMYKNMFKYPEIDQYQLIQEDKKKYRFIISSKNGFKKEKIIKDELITFLGDDAIFEVEYIDEIPLLDSGKRRKIVNNYIKNKGFR